MSFKNQGKKSTTALFKILDELIHPNLVCNQHGIILFANNAYKKWGNKPHKNQPFWISCSLSLDRPNYFQEAIEKKTKTQCAINCKGQSFMIHVIPISNVLIHDCIYVVYFENITLEMTLNQQLTDNNQFAQQSFLNTLCAFSEMIESRDPFTSGHQKRVASLSLNIAARANITDPQLIAAIYYGALIHDIGKIAIPMEYLVTPKPLTEYEYEIIKTHVSIGNKIIQPMDFPWDMKSVVYQHHERMDGSGYPNHLKGEEISVPARIVTIADVYDAMSSNRPYRQSIARETIVDYFKENQDTLFDAHYVGCLFQCLSELSDVYQERSQFKLFNFM